MFFQMWNIKLRGKIEIFLISLGIILLLLLPQVLISLEKLWAILLTIVLLLDDVVLHALVIDEMPASESAQKEHLGGSALQAPNIWGVEIHLFERINVLADVLGDIRICCCHKVNQFVWILLDLTQFIEHLIVEGFLTFTLYKFFYLQLVRSSLLCPTPSSVSILADEWMFYVFIVKVARLAKFKGCT